MFYMYVYDKNVHKHVIDADIYTKLQPIWSASKRGRVRVV